MRSLPAPGTVWQTLRHLRPRQVRYQIARRMLPAGLPVPLAMAWRPARPEVGRAKNTRRVYHDAGADFDFNNERRSFGGDWNEAGARKLWLYNLHYMAWLFDLEASESREEWIRKWIWDNPPGRGGNGWEPYPLSLRLFNWCKHYSLAGISPDRAVLASMEQQAACLLEALEFHLDGNHLLENLLALAFAGFFLDMGDLRSARAGKHIQGLLEAALSEQFLPDGGHYELSPMYHAILLERILDLLDCWPLGQDPFPGLKDRLRAVALLGLDWLDAMTVGERFALFNDSAYDTAPSADLLLDYGSRLLSRQPFPRVPLRSLKASGYFRAEAGPATLIFDGGKLGPDHQMGHAQGDMLSFCLWMGDVPVIVHPGNFEYVPGAMRDYCRSTASHNTLVLDGREQADWWASHRVGWRGRPGPVAATSEADRGKVRIRGSHDGFSRLPGSPIHSREIEMTSTTLVVRDSLSAGGERASKVYFHFHPDCILERGNGTMRIRYPGGSLLLESDHSMTLKDTWYCPEFGLRLGNRAVVVEGASQEFRSVFTFEDR